jgi:hypothetical protein
MAVIIVAVVVVDDVDIGKCVDVVEVCVDVVEVCVDTRSRSWGPFQLWHPKLPFELLIIFRN